MNYYRNTTQVPNELFDIYLPDLTKSELKVLLIVIRQTLGWLNMKTGKRKRKDRISLSFFIHKTGLERKSISIAIHSLIQKDLLIALGYRDRELKTAKERQGKKRIYYAYKPYFRAEKEKTCVENGQNIGTYQPITKPIPSKLNKQKPQKQTDRERILEILREQERMNQ